VPLLHDAQCKTETLRRLQSLRADNQRRWGKMSVGQMLWHVNEAMEGALGHIVVDPARAPLPRPLLKFLVLNAPWGKGAPTLKRWIPQADNYDFAAERDRCVRLLEELTSKPLVDAWPDSPMLGRMSGKDVSRLHAKHLNHHLTQFGV
jgi:Protein of unknown function (DUF1569)